MSPFINLMQSIRAATLSARTRTNDPAIGTRVQSGRVQVVRVTYASDGSSTVTPLSGWVAIDDAVSTINAI